MIDTSVIERLYTRLLLAIGRGRITAVNDGGPVQVIQIKLGQDDVRDGTPRLAEYGLTSAPPAGSDAVILCIAGDRSTGVVVATGNQAARLKGLAAGEVALYDDQGQSIHLTRAGIVIKGAGKPVIVEDTPMLTVKAATKVRFETPLLEVSGEIKDRSDGGGKTMAGMRQTYDAHTHGGVQPGNGHTSSPEQGM